MGTPLNMRVPGLGRRKRREVASARSQQSLLLPTAAAPCGAGCVTSADGPRAGRIGRLTYLALWRPDLAWGQKTSASAKAQAGAAGSRATAGPARRPRLAQ